MAFTEDLDVFFSDFNDTVVYDSATYKGILEQPDEIVADGVVMTTDYMLTAKTVNLGSLLFDSSLTVNGDTYRVRNTRKIDDGSLCILSLMKIDVTAPTLISSSPAHNATGVSVSANIILTFSEDVYVESGNITIKKTSDDSTVETIAVTSGQVTGTGTTQITINPSADFDAATEYYVQIDATAFDDAVGNSYAGISDKTSLSFTTA